MLKFDYIMSTDPIQQVENVIRGIHDKGRKHVQPVLRRYPLLFTFLIVFSVSAIMHGFDLVSDQIEILHSHPVYLILIGVVVLLLTGMLYKALEGHRS